LTQQKATKGGGFFDSLLSFGSSLFGGGSTTAIDTSVISPFAEGGSVRGGQPITVGERGREVFMPKSDGTIIPSEKLGGVNNINFTIQSADVRGIKELLIDNRATITNIVNQALNARGRPALI
jgi:phage-related minor tail protein